MVTKDNPGGDPGSGSKPTGTDTIPAGDGTTPGPTGDKGTESKDQLYTKDQVTDLIHREIGKVVKKASKEKEDLLAQINELKSQGLPETERAQLKIAEQERIIADKDLQIADLQTRELKRSKLEGRISGGKISLPQSASISDIMGMIYGSEDPEIDESLNKLEKLFPPSKKSVGAGSQAGPQPGDKTLDEEIAETETALKNPSLSRDGREELQKRLIRLTNKKFNIYPK